jgi:thioredoxin 1
MDWLPLLLFAMILLVLLIQVAPRLRANRMKGQPAPDMGRLLSEEQQGSDRLLVYFFSPRCGLCRKMNPLIQRLQAEHPQVVSVDVSGNIELARQFGVLGTPTVVLVRHGKVAEVRTGMVSEQQIRWLLEEAA